MIPHSAAKGLVQLAPLAQSSGVCPYLQFSSLYYLTLHHAENSVGVQLVDGFDASGNMPPQAGTVKSLYSTLDVIIVGNSAECDDCTLSSGMMNR